MTLKAPFIDEVYNAHVSGNTEILRKHRTPQVYQATNTLP